MSNEFLSELRIQFNEVLEIKDKLDSKATNMITVAGIMAAIVMGFGSQLLENLDNDSDSFQWAKGLLVGQLSLTVASVIISIIAYRVKDYEFPFVRKEFLTDERKFIDSKIDEYLTMNQETQRELIMKYIKSIKRNEIENDRKADKIGYALYILLAAIILIPVFAAIIIYG